MSRENPSEDDPLLKALLAKYAKRYGRPISFGEEAVIRRVYRKRWRPDCNDKRFFRRLEASLSHHHEMVKQASLPPVIIRKNLD